MNGPTPKLVRQLKVSGLLLSTGLVIEAGTLYWSHPTTFLAFILGGGALVGAGILLYLWTIVSR